MRMIPIILNSNFEKTVYCDDFISFIWTSRFYTAGDFELILDISRANDIQIGYYIAREDEMSNEAYHLGVVEEVKATMSETRQETITIKGRLLPGLFSRRVIASQTQLDGAAQDCISAIVNENAIAPTNSDRKLYPRITFSTPQDNDDEVEVQYFGENLLDAVSNLCESYSFGLDGMYIPATDTLAFSIYRGTDRSFGQSENPYVVFSDKYDNLLTSEYTENFSDYATDVLVGGEGEGANQTIVWSANQSQSGLDRYETYLDASSAVSNENIITQATYESQLDELGLLEISSKATYTSAFSGEVDFSNVKLNEDVFVGDIVTIQNSKWGMSINSRIVEIIESTDASGVYTAIPTFGK